MLAGRCTSCTNSTGSTGIPVSYSPLRDAFADVIHILPWLASNLGIKLSVEFADGFAKPGLCVWDKDVPCDARMCIVGALQRDELSVFVSMEIDFLMGNRDDASFSGDNVRKGFDRLARRADILKLGCAGEYEKVDKAAASGRRREPV